MNGIKKYYNAVAGSGMFGAGLFGMFLSRRNNLSEYFAVVSIYLTCAGLYYLSISLTEDEHKVSKGRYKNVSKPAKKRSRSETPTSGRKVKTVRKIRLEEMEEERKKTIENLIEKVSTEMRIHQKLNEKEMKILENVSRKLLMEIKLAECLEEEGRKIIEFVSKEMTQELDEEGKRIIENLKRIMLRQMTKPSVKNKIAENCSRGAFTEAHTEKLDEKKTAKHLCGGASAEREELGEKKFGENMNGGESKKAEDFDEKKVQKILTKEVSTEIRNRLELTEQKKNIIEALNAIQIDYTISKNTPVIIKPSFDASNIGLEPLRLQELGDAKGKDIVIETAPIKMQIIDMKNFSTDDSGKPLRLADVIKQMGMNETSQVS